MAYSFSGSMVSGLASDVVRSSFLELNTFNAEDGIPAVDMAYGLEKLQRLVDQWNAMREAIFNHTFAQFTLLANHAPHTIGPTGDFNVAVRPVRIFSAAFILNSGSPNPVDLPINAQRDSAWWAANPLKSQQSSVVTDLYYDPSIPNGNLNFWPISNIANPVRLEYFNSLTQAVTLGTSLGFAPGYWDAMVLALAEALAGPYDAPPNLAAVIMSRKLAAMRTIFANNNAPPRITTDAGMPSPQRSGRPDFDFLTGLNDN